MPPVNIVVESKVSRSPRARQLEAIFDVPPQDTQTLQWKGDFPYDDEPWNVGLIVGPSGSGKSTIANNVFNVPEPFTWNADCVLDDFNESLSIEDISKTCQAVGFNTIPAWTRPYRVLSMGERFRVEMARALLERKSPIVIDEFTSVVDRQVAKIGSHAVQKHVRRNDKQFVAVSCHHDIIEWLQPDWIFEPATMSLTRRRLQQRPPLQVTVAPVPYNTWNLFAPFHYLTKTLHKAAACFALFVGDNITSLAAMLYRPHPQTRNIYGISRLVTLPDWQGLGLAFVLVETVASAMKTMKYRMHTYPAHPPLIRAFDKSPKWVLKKRPGNFSPPAGTTSTLVKNAKTSKRNRHVRVPTDKMGQDPKTGTQIGGRPCAVFEYCGESMNENDAKTLLSEYNISKPKRLPLKRRRI